MKPKYRYNNKTGQCGKLYRISSETIEIAGATNPKTGLLICFSRSGLETRSPYVGLRSTSRQMQQRLYNYQLSSIVDG